jgi:hypothetical protein
MRRRRPAQVLIAIALTFVIASDVLATTVLPFSWTLTVASTYDGRDMISNTGTFCEWFHSTQVNPADPDKHVYISLWLPLNGAPPEQVGITVSYPANGAQYVYCWRGFTPGKTFYFEFVHARNGYQISAAGSAQDH